MIILIISLFFFYCASFLIREILSKPTQNYRIDISSYNICLKDKSFKKIRRNYKDDNLSSLFFNKALNIKGHKSEIIKFV